MMEKRYFIFRVNGNDNCILDDSTKVKELYDMFLDHGFKEVKTEVNFLTTTYYFTI